MKALFGTVPLILRWLAFYGLTGVLFIIGPLLPFANFSIEDKSISWTEFWASGAAAAMVCAGVYLWFMGCGILLRRRWPRALVLGLIPFSFLLYLPFGGVPSPMLPFAILSSAAWPIGMVWYLFFKRSVRAYFALPPLTVKEALTFHSTGPANAGR
ncbi:MAG TPA: hypothetical protein VFL31_00895 [Nitrospiraceae bacterium]|nr:hypothetical protein [Nitrospiraceae bacterium]